MRRDKRKNGAGRNRIAVFAVMLFALAQGVFAAELYVPSAEYPTIQSGIDGAVDYDEIEVAPGTYYEAIDFIGKAIHLYSSSGPDVTIIDGTGYYHVVQCVSGEGPDTILEGFTLTGGKANGPLDSDKVGGGMYNYYSSPTVAGCTFSQNSASYRGGGGMANEYSDPVVTGCTFSDNYAVEPGGGMVNKNSNPIVTDCVFINNTAHDLGGGMYNFNSSPTVTNCSFSDNTTQYMGGGMHNYHSCPTVTNCSFTRNFGYAAGGGMNNFFYSSPTLTNCTFNGNMSAFHGGGMNNAENSNPVVTNCTFTGNFYEGLYNSSTSPAVTNCIFWDNYPNQVYNTGTSSPIITYSNIAGGYTGIGNIDADPLFVDAENEDYHLQADSPCIDAGDPDYPVDPSETDLGGDLRVTDGDGDGQLRIDMGCYEYQPPVVVVEVKVTPSVLNVVSSGKFVVAHIEWPEGAGINPEDIEEVLLEDVIYADEVLISEDKMVTAKFDRAAVSEYLIGSGLTGEIELTITGRLVDSTIFEGKDTITVKE